MGENKTAMRTARWLADSGFALFFADLRAWCEAVGENPVWQEQYGVLLPTDDAGTAALLQEYDDLFRGTHADIYIPLWASACKAAGDSIYDETTVAVIRTYRAAGYTPICMEANPADYIGQQFRFLAYLTACAFHDTADAAMYEEQIEAFTVRYLLDTVQCVANGIERYSKTPLFLAIAAGMRQRAAESVPAIAVPHTSLAAWLACYDACLYGAGAAQPVEDAYVVNTAGRNNCGGRCAIRVTAQEGCITGLDVGCQGEPQLRMCLRGRSYRKTYMSGRRLRYPMIRIGARGEGRFRRVTWEEAVKHLAAEWVRIRDAYGVGSRFVNYSTGVQGVLRPDQLAKRLLNMDGGRLDYYGTYSNLCANYIAPYIYGDIFNGNSVEDLLHTKLLILWANNPSETITGSQRAYYTALAREKGMRVIVIDPRQSDSALSFADEWIGIRPSTDGALADAMAYVIWSEGLQDQHFMDTYCLGFDEDHMPDGVPQELNYKNYLFGGLDGVVKTAEWGEAITGVPAETIRRIAIAYATTKPACLLPGLGNQRIGNGEQTVRGMAMLTCLTGNVGVSGGGAAGSTIAMEEPGVFFPQGKNNYPGAISCFLWTKAIENGVNMTQKSDRIQGMDRLESNIKMLFNLAGNILINQHSDVNNSIRVLKRTDLCECIVCSDVFMTPSARYADVLLPAPSFLEDEDIVGMNITGHYLLCDNQVIPPLFDARNEFSWLGDLAKEIGVYEAWSEGHVTTDDWLRDLYAGLRQKKPELPEYEVFRANGGYTYKNAPCYIAYKKQIEDPEHYKFATPSGKIEIFSKRLYDLGDPVRIPALPVYTPCPEGPEDPLREKYPLQLIGWHTKRRCHSIHDNNAWLEETDPHCVWIHPADAAARGIAEGDLVEVFNDRGCVRIKAKITNRIIAGAAAMSQGAWYTPDENGIDIRGCINTLTSTEPTPLAKGNPQHTNLVEIRRTVC